MKQSFGERFGVIEVLKRDEGSVVGWAFDQERSETTLVRRLVDSVRSEDYAREALEAEAAYTNRLDSRCPQAELHELPDGEACLLYSHSHGAVLERILHAMEASGRTFTPAAATVIVSEVLHTAKAIQRVRARSLTGTSLWGHGEIEPRGLIVGEDGLTRLYDVRYAATGLMSDPSPMALVCRPPELTEASPTGSPAGDVYSVGAVLALCVLGPRALLTDDDESLVRSVQKALSERSDDIEDGFGFVLTTALATRPRERFENSNVMRIALRQCAYLSSDQWQNQLDGLARLAKLFSSDDPPSEIPMSVLDEFEDMTLINDAAEPTLAAIPGQRTKELDAADQEVVDAMGALGLPASNTRPSSIGIVAPKGDLTASALAVLDEVSETNFSRHAEEIGETTTDFGQLAEEPTRELEIDPTAQMSAVRRDDEDAEAPQTIETNAQDLERVLAKAVRDGIAETDARLETVDAELIGEVSGAFESVTDEVDQPESTDLEPQYDTEMAGETSKSFESITDEVDQPDATELDQPAVTMEEIAAARAAADIEERVSDIEETQDGDDDRRPVHIPPNVPTFNDVIPTGTGRLALSVGGRTDVRDSLVGKAGVPDNVEGDRPDKKSITIALPSSGSRPAKARAQAPVADEFDDDRLSDAAPVPLVTKKQGKGKGKKGKKPRARPSSAISAAAVPAVGDSIRDLSSGPVLSDSSVPETTQNAPLPAPVRRGSGARRPAIERNVSSTRGEVHQARLTNAPPPRHDSGIGIRRPTGIPLEQLDPDVTPALKLPRPQSRTSSFAKRPNSRPAPRRSSTIPPPRFESESQGGRLAFMAVLAVALAVVFFVMLSDRAPRDTGAVVGISPTPTTVGRTSARSSVTSRGVVTDERTVDAKTPEGAVAAAQPKLLGDDGDDEAARKGYGETDTLEATGQYDKAGRREALGVWRLDDQAASDAAGRRGQGASWEEELASAPAYVASDRYVEDEPYGGDDERDWERELGQSGAPYIWGGPAPSGAARAGRLVINVIPWGNVYIDGRSYGYPPVVVRWLSAGQHTIRVERPGFETTERVVDLAANEDKSVHVRFKQLGDE